MHGSHRFNRRNSLHERAAETGESDAREEVKDERRERWDSRRSSADDGSTVEACGARVNGRQTEKIHKATNLFGYISFIHLALHQRPLIRGSHDQTHSSAYICHVRFQAVLPRAPPPPHLLLPLGFRRALNCSPQVPDMSLIHPMSIYGLGLFLSSMTATYCDVFPYV